MGVSLFEQETVIQFNREGKECIIYTSDSTMMTKLDKLCKSSPDFYKLMGTDTVQGELVSKKYKLTDKSLISLRSTKVTRVMTEEEKQIAAERMRNMAKKSAEQRRAIAAENFQDSDDKVIG